MKNFDQKFWNRHAAKYAKRPVPDQAVYEQKLNLTQQHLKPNMRLFEFGCGTGSTALIHAPLVEHITAIDVSDQMIAIAKNKAEQQNITNIDFLTSTIDDFDAGEQRFDVVLGLSILHLLKNTQQVVKQVSQMLNPGGLLVTSTPCLGDSMKIFKWLGPIGRFLGLLPTLHVFDQQALERFMLNADFDIIHQWQPAPGKAVFMIAQKKS